jgi:hypothetical protein
MAPKWACWDEYSSSFLIQGPQYFGGVAFGTKASEFFVTEKAWN